MASKSKLTEPFNNEEWVTLNKLTLHPNDPSKTYEIAKTNHPNMGDPYPLSMNRAPIIKELYNSDLKTAAKYADVVTICCFETLGFNDVFPHEDSLIKNISLTVVGNIAYTALHHSTERVRDSYYDLFNKWKSLWKPTLSVKTSATIEEIPNK